MRITLLVSILFLTGCAPNSSTVKQSVSSVLKQSVAVGGQCSGEVSTWSDCTGSKQFDGYVYTGKFLNGVPNGLGEELWTDGTRYIGSYVAGSRNGQFENMFPNGDSFSGEFVADKRNGPGTYRYADGTVFTGGYKDGKKHGIGTFRYANGQVTVSDFVDDQRSGQVSFTYADGAKKWGYAFEGKLAPFRVIRRSSGLIGLIMADEKGGFDGPGIWFDPDTNLATLANYSSGKMAGKIVRFDAEGHIADISIMANDQVIDGASSLPFGNPNNDSTFEYQCIDNNYLAGRCAVRQPYTAGGYYEGGYTRDSEPDGYGIRVYKSGDVYRGEYLAGEQNGYFSYFWPDGTKSFGYQQKEESQGLEIYVQRDGSILFSVVTDDEADGLAIDFDPASDEISWFNAKGESYTSPTAEVFNEKIRSWEEYAATQIPYSFDDDYRKIAETIAYTTDHNGIYWPSEDQVHRSGSTVADETVSFWTNDSGTVEGRVMVYDSPEQKRSVLYNGLLNVCREAGGSPIVALPVDRSRDKISGVSQAVLCTDYGDKGTHVTTATHSLKSSDDTAGVVILEMLQHGGETAEVIAKFKRASGEI